MTLSDTSALRLPGGGYPSRPRQAATPRAAGSERLQALRRRRNAIRKWVATGAGLIFVSTGAVIGAETHTSTSSSGTTSTGSGNTVAQNTAQSSSTNASSGSTNSSSGSTNASSGSTNSASGSTSAVTSGQS